MFFYGISVCAGKKTSHAMGYSPNAVSAPVGQVQLSPAVLSWQLLFFQGVPLVQEYICHQLLGRVYGIFLQIRNAFFL